LTGSNFSSANDALLKPLHLLRWFFYVVPSTGWSVKSVKLFLKPFSGKIISKEYTFNSEHEIRLKYYFVKSVKLFLKPFSGKNNSNRIHLEFTSW